MHLPFVLKTSTTGAPCRRGLLLSRWQCWRQSVDRTCCCCCCCWRRSGMLTRLPCRVHRDISTVFPGWSVRTSSDGLTSPKMSVLVDSVPAHSRNQCSRVCAPSPHLGHIGSTAELSRWWYALKLKQWPLRTWARNTASLRDLTSARSLAGLIFL